MTIDLEAIRRSLGAIIKSYRAKKRLTGRELGAKADVKQSYLSKLERGEHNPSFNTLAKIAAALEVPLSQLIKEAEDLEKEGE